MSLYRSLAKTLDSLAGLTNGEEQKKQWFSWCSQYS